ncbi:hypothetical protein FMUND_2004 [Fusarium mundagurra]|uniref:Fungal N-terminal domain-containing protein n=1 Tax=Fusarium mundagurra TaxID=1567541 RepID=A0A8H5Z3H7_9HYPO|nr:hypothetical protein FMUND_2004 [Fusarium mundagurra]
MAEAFGIAGSAFGTVSLGLQLFKEISQYLDDIDGREEDLKEARNYATNIQLSLNALDIAISNAPTNGAATKNAIDSCKASCVSAVNNLLAVVKQLRDPTITLPNGNAARAKELYGKLKYPFKKQNIEKLEEILSRTNSALQTILQVFQLSHATTSALNNMHQAVAALNTMSEKNKNTLGAIHKTSQFHDNRLSTIQQDVRELLILTRQSEDTKLLLRTMAQQVSDLTSRTSIDPKLLQNPESEIFIPGIQTTDYQGGGSMSFNSFCSCKTQRARYSQRLWGPFLLEAEVRSRDHHTPECPMSKLPESTRRTKRVLSLLIPTSQRLWGRASRVSLSFTTGAGILGLGQTVTWIATVDVRASPVFRLVDTIKRYLSLPHKEMNTLLASCFRRLVWCYANSHASITDVTEGGDTILGWALIKYLFTAGEYNADNIAELLHMLTIIAEPSSCTRSITAEAVGHHHKWEMTWERDKYHVGGGYRLFQAFPQAAEQFGPLTRAVLAQDRNRVQQLLERCPLHIHETNYCGQSPLHLAIETQNIAIISVLLHYTDTRTLHTRDNRGKYPIDYHQLEAQGCPVPTCLSVYGENFKSPYDHKSIYSLISDGETAEYAHQLGFYYSENEFADFICSLASHMSHDPIEGYLKSRFSSSYLCWMIDHGTSISSRLPARTLPSPEIEVTAAHYFMASLGLSWQGQQELALYGPLSLAAVEIVFSETMVDRCDCWCSPGGCTPLVKLLEGIYWRRFSFESEEHLSQETERLIYGLLSPTQDKIIDSPRIYAAIIRYYTFVELGLRHICCLIIGGARGPLPAEEFQEIAEEESSLLGLFESLLTEFEDGHLQDMSLEEFFRWMCTTWAPRMQHVKAELASRKLTDGQLRDAESVGVVWEAYGPQPMDESSEGSDVGECDLWDAMDELDQIAPDPERPMKESLQFHT